MRRLLTATLLAGLMVWGPAAQSGVGDGGTWSVLATSGDVLSERSTPAVVAIRGRLYAFGGVRDEFRTFTNTFYDDLHRLDPSTGMWTELSPAGPVPRPRAFAAGAGDEATGRMFVFGGATYGPMFAGFIAHSDLWAYSVTSNTWTQLHPGTLGGPLGRSRPNMWLAGTKLYVFGGINAAFQTMNDLWVYDLAAGQWTLLVPNGAPGSPPHRHEALADTSPHGGKLTLYGGEQFDLLAGGFVMLDDTWQFDLSSGTWQEVSLASADDVSPPRNYGSAAIVDDNLYMHGGDIPGGSSGCGAPFPQNTTDELWRFDLTAHRWSRLESGGDPLVRLKRDNAAVVDGRMYIVAGYDFLCETEDDPGQIWNTNVYVYQPPGS